MYRLFGRPTLDGETTCASMPAKGFLLIGYLATSLKKRENRLAIAELFWPERETEKAFANLRQLLRRIRKFELETETKIVSSQANDLLLHLSPDQLDISHFNHVSSKTDDLDLASFVSIYSQEFLAGHEFLASGALGSWLRATRIELAQRCIDVAVTIATDRRALADIPAIRTLLKIHPADERLFRSLISILKTHGRRAEAIQAINQFLMAFKEDLDGELEPATIELINGFQPNPSQVSDNSNTGSSPGKGPGGLPVLCVLPPENDLLTNNAANLNLARSFVDDVALSLCQSTAFCMLAPYSAQQFISTNIADGRLYNLIDFVVRTHVRPAPSGNPELVVSLVELSTQRLLFRQNVVIDIQTLTKSYRPAVERLAFEVGQYIDSLLLDQVTEAPTPSAYGHYLLGQKQYHPGRLQSVRAAKNSFKRALAQAPDFTRATRMYAKSLNQEWFLLGDPDKSKLLDSWQLLHNALVIRPYETETIWELGLAELYLGRFDGALENVSTARIRAPHHADIIHDYADILVHKGAHQEALVEIGIAMRLNPLCPDDYYWVAGAAEFLLGRYPEALDWLYQVKGKTSVLRIVAACHAMLGNRHRAELYRDRFLDEYPGFRVDIHKNLVPLQQKTDRDHMREALLCAGFV